VAWAQEQPDRPRSSLRFYLGYATQTLTEVNDAIEFNIPVQWDTFGGALEYGAELDVMVSDVASIGAALGIQGSEVNNAYSDWSGAAVSDKIKLKVIDVSGTLAFWPPSTPGLYFGVSGGLAFGSADSEFRFTIYDDPSSDIVLDGEFSGNGLSLGIFGGYQAPIAESGLFFVKAGYRHRKLGEFDGRACSPGYGCVDASASNNAGQPLDFDLSGFHIRAGVAFAFGEAGTGPR